jgi:hypothetical protein
MFGYHVPAPDEAILISGGKDTASDAPFRVRAWTTVTPFLRAATRTSTRAGTTIREQRSAKYRYSASMPTSNMHRTELPLGCACQLIMSINTSAALAGSRPAHGLATSSCVELYQRADIASDTELGTGGQLRWLIGSDPWRLSGCAPRSSNRPLRLAIGSRVR